MSKAEKESVRQGEKKFDLSYEPERIVGVINIDGSIHFLIKWKNRLECDLIGSAKAREKCPDLVIDFYEKNIRWI